MMLFHPIAYFTGVIEELNTAYLELPYRGENGVISMYVLLPVFTANAIDVLLQNFTSEILEKVLSANTFEEVDVEFPKISFERRFKFVPVRLFHVSVYKINTLHRALLIPYGFT